MGNVVSITIWIIIINYYRKPFVCDIVITKLINELSATVELLHSFIAIVFVNIFCVKCNFHCSNKPIAVIIFVVISNVGSEGHYIWSAISYFLFSFISLLFPLDFFFFCIFNAFPLITYSVRMNRNEIIL